MKFIEQYMAAHRAGVPLIAVRTPDPATTIANITTAVTDAATAKQEPVPPCIIWDIARGLTAANKEGAEVIRGFCEGRDPSFYVNLADSIGEYLKLPERTVVYMLNAHLFMRQEPIVQGIWNLRDPFKATRRRFIMLCPQITLPLELVNDVVLLDEPYPTREELGAMVTEIYDSVDKKPTEAELSRSVDATIGLASFPAEQVLAMSINRETGMDFSLLWEQKRQVIEQTRGLKLYRGTETELAGVANYFDFMKNYLTGPMEPNVMVILDEIGDAMAGTAGDNTGVSQDIHGAILSFMESKKVPGILSVGVPGVGKTYGPGVLSTVFNKPLIIADIGAMKEAEVGRSEANARNFLKVVEAMSGGRMLFIGTTNSTANISPQLMSRFRYTFFHDIPTADGRAAAWKIYMKQYKLEAQPLPDDNNWTPREIRNCCESAYALKCSLVDASRYVVPVYKSGAEDIAKLRAEANGRYIDADRPGFYQTPTAVMDTYTQTRRRQIDADIMTKRGEA